MSNNIHLIGAEQVARAGGNISGAADQMSRAASSIEDTTYRHQQFMTQWLSDLNNILQENKKP